MKILHTLTCTVAIALATLLAGCDGETIIGSDSGGFHHLTLRNGTLTAHAQGAPDATISPTGELRIDDKAVAVTSEQRELLKKYYVDVVAIREAGIETGKAGAAMAGHAIGAVASGLAHGDPDSIGQKIDAHAQEVEAKADVICENLATLHTTQDAIVASLPTFKPYASIETTEVNDCLTESRDRKNRTERAAH